MQDRTDDSIREWMTLNFPNENTGSIPLALGLEEAFIGVITTEMIAVYDYEKCILALMGQGMEHDEAVDWFHINTLGSSIDPQSPFYVDVMEIKKGDL